MLLKSQHKFNLTSADTTSPRARARKQSVGPLLASAFVATIADPRTFKSERCIAAWIRHVPKQNSSGGKEKLGSISKAGNRYLRQLLMVGSMAVIRYTERNGTRSHGSCS